MGQIESRDAWNPLVITRDSSRSCGQSAVPALSQCLGVGLGDPSIELEVQMRAPMASVGPYWSYRGSMYGAWVFGVDCSGRATEIQRTRTALVEPKMGLLPTLVAPSIS